MQGKENISENDIPFLTEGYYKSHRAYVGVSALLLSWELVGIKVTEQPLDNYNISLKSPEAFPLVLVVLVFYFMFKSTIEWHHCDRERRDSLPAKIDFYFAHFIGFLSIVLYGVQQAIKSQIFDLITFDIQINFVFSWVALLSAFFSVRAFAFIYLKIKMRFVDKIYSIWIILLFPMIYLFYELTGGFEHISINSFPLYVYLSCLVLFFTISFWKKHKIWLFNY